MDASPTHHQIGRARWTPAELAWLAANYGAHGGPWCARRLKRSAVAVKVRAHWMGLSRGGQRARKLRGLNTMEAA